MNIWHQKARNESLSLWPMNDGQQNSMTSKFIVEQNRDAFEVLNNLIYVLSNFKNGLIFIQEDKQLSEHSKVATRNHVIVPQDFDPVYTSRNKRLVHKTISNIMKAG